MRRIAISICVCAAAMAASAGSAGAATLAPGSANFGNQAVGSTSAPRTFTLTPDLLDILPLTIATTGDFKQTNNCAAVLQFVSGPCTINVTFTPTAAGNRSGTLSSTAVVLGGPTAQLTGTGTASQDGGKGADAKKACKKKKGKRKRGKKGATAAKKKKGKKGKCKKRKKKGKKK